MARTLLALIGCFFSLAALAVDLERKVDFNIPAQTLSAALIQFSHQAKIQVVIKDPAIAGLRFTGTVFTASLADWVKAIEQSYPVRADRAANGDIVLVARR